jgi:hypothetical protein
LLTSGQFSLAFSEDISFEKIQSVLEKNHCNLCHEYSTMTLSDFLSQGLISPGELSLSPLFYRLKKDFWPKEWGEIIRPQSPFPENMPRGTKYPALSAEDLKVVKDFILQLPPPENSMNELDLTPGSKGDNESDEQKNSFTIRPRLIDRQVIYHHLIKIFGPEARPIIQKQILNHPSDFGGPCSLYSLSNEKWKSCLNADPLLTQAPLIPGSSTISEGRRFHLCQELTERTSLITHALNQLAGAPTENLLENHSLLVPVLTQAYQLFYPAQVIPEKILRKFWEIETSPVKEAKKLIWEKHWKVFFLNVCLTPNWMIP